MKKHRVGYINPQIELEFYLFILLELNFMLTNIQNINAKIL